MNWQSDCIILWETSMHTETKERILTLNTSECVLMLLINPDFITTVYVNRGNVLSYLWPVNILAQSSPPLHNANYALHHRCNNLKFMLHHFNRCNMSIIHVDGWFGVFQNTYIGHAFNDFHLSEPNEYYIKHQGTPCLHFHLPFLNPDECCVWMEACIQ